MTAGFKYFQKFLSKWYSDVFGTLLYNLDKVFKNGPSQICRRQPLKSFKGYGLPKAYYIPSNFLKAVFH